MIVRLRAAARLLVALACTGSVAQAPDVAAIQAREARNADARTLAAFERCRQALVARFGADPKLTMLEWGETECAALVVAQGGATAFVIRQGDEWKSTANRKLEPWAEPATASANAFPLSSVRPAAIRAWLDAWRAVPGQATDFVTRYSIGYDPALRRVAFRGLVGSMATGKLTLVAFDPADGRTIGPVAGRR